MKDDEFKVFVENNILIATFMEAKLIPNHYGIYDKPIDHYEFDINPGLDNCKLYIAEVMCYSTDWNWLMQVVEKIEKLAYRFTISSSFVRVHTCKKSWDDTDEYSTVAFEGKLNTTYHAVIEFIKWYNIYNK